jgi:hypothetical protein
MTATINTAKVANRRQLHFNSVDEILADVEQLAKGKIRTLGNWTPAQILTHLATHMDKSIDGFKGRPPWFIRLVGRWYFKNRFLNKGMPPGFQLPANAAKEFIADPGVRFEESLAGFRRAVERQKTETKRVPSPFLGPMTLEDWNRLHCRHAELHLSFLTPA